MRLAKGVVRVIRCGMESFDDVMRYDTIRWDGMGWDGAVYVKCYGAYIGAYESCVDYVVSEIMAREIVGRRGDEKINRVIMSRFESMRLCVQRCRADRM